MTNRQIKATNYFSHDSNARNDEKVLRLRMKHGAAGYGVYFMLLERLREETNYMSAKDYNMIAFDLRVDASLVKSVIEDFGLFTFTENGKRFYSESFKRRMDVKDVKQSQLSEAGKKGMKTRWSKQKSENEPVTTKSNAQPTTKAASAPSVTDNEKFLERFFRKSNQANIEVLLMNMGMKPGDTPVLRKLAEEVVAEWKMSEKIHADYTDWSQHLIATMRIKRNQSGSAKSKDNEQNEPPTPADYQFGGGFGGKDV